MGFFFYFFFIIYLFILFYSGGGGWQWLVVGVAVTGVAWTKKKVV